MDELKRLLENIANIPCFLMSLYLRKMGWVAFYLEEEARVCDNETCWLRLYQYEIGRATRPPEQRNEAEQRYGEPTVSEVSKSDGGAKEPPYCAYCGTFHYGYQDHYLA